MRSFRIIRLIALLLITSMVFTIVGGCRNDPPEELPLSGRQFAIVVKNEGNSYFERIIEGFSAIVESLGGEVLVKEPSQATAEEQIGMINELISNRVDGIAIATNSEFALTPSLQRAKEQGIQVISFDSAVESSSRALHINQADAQIIAKTLMDAAYDITGGSGQIAIMSTTNQASNQNAWINEMRRLLEAGVYPELMLVSIVFGEDEYYVTYQRTQQLIDNFPELSLIIAPTAAGLPAVAQCIIDNGLEHRIKVTGLGMPSLMAEYIGDNRVCPYMFLWDLDLVGKLTAYALIALVNGEITGEVGERLVTADMGTFLITDDPFGGSEIVLQAELIRFDESNIDYWKDVF